MQTLARYMTDLGFGYRIHDLGILYEICLTYPKLGDTLAKNHYHCNRRSIEAVLA